MSTTRKRRRQISFLVWGAPALLALLAFCFAPFAPEDAGPTWALGGLYGLFACAIGHAVTCLAIDRLSKPE